MNSKIIQGLFLEKNQTITPKKLKLWRFWEVLSKNTIWKAFYKNRPRLVVLIKMKDLFEKVYRFPQKTLFDRFGNW